MQLLTAHGLGKLTNVLAVEFRDVLGILGRNVFADCLNDEAAAAAR
jgi:hypothetical protein